MRELDRGGESRLGDRRREARLEVERPCRLIRAGQRQAELVGFTCNLSRSGMLLRFPGATQESRLPKVGEFVRVLVGLPKAPVMEARAFDCVGKVVRDEGVQGADRILAVEVYRVKVADWEERAGGFLGEAGLLIQ